VTCLIFILWVKAAPTAVSTAVRRKNRFLYYSIENKICKVRNFEILRFAQKNEKMLENLLKFSKKNDILICDIIHMDALP